MLQFDEAFTPSHTLPRHRRFRVVALPWATIASYLLLSAVPIAMYVPRLLGRMRGSRVPLDWKMAR